MEKRSASLFAGVSAALFVVLSVATAPRPSDAQSAVKTKSVQSTKPGKAAAPFPAAAPAETAKVGKPFRDFALRDIAAPNGATFTLSSLKYKKAFVGVFMANRCGATWAIEDKIAKLLKAYEGEDVEIVAIHSNYEESDKEIRTTMQQRGLDMTILDDKKTQALADYVEAFGTPLFFIVDKDGILRYKGAFDRYGDDKHPYLVPALDSVLAGTEVKTPVTRALGCEIKRRPTPKAQRR